MSDLLGACQRFLARHSGKNIDEVVRALQGFAGTIGPGFVPVTRQILAGIGLTGGGDLTADRTISLQPHPDGSIAASGAGTQVGVLATDAQHGNRGGGAQHAIVTPSPGGSPGFMDPSMLDLLIALGVNAVPDSRQINTTAPLQGGGDLSVNRTLSILPATSLAAGSLAAADKAWIDQRQHEMAVRPEMAGPAASVLALTNNFQGSQNVAPFRGRFDRMRARLTGHTVVGAGIRVAVYQVPGGLARGNAALLGEAVVTPTVVGAQDLNFAFVPFDLERGYYYVVFGRSAVAGGTSNVQTWTIGTVLRFTSGVAAGDVPVTFTTAVSSTLAAPPTLNAPGGLTASTLSQALCARLVG